MATNPYRETVGRMARRGGLTKTRRLYFERLQLNYHGLKREEPFDYHVQSEVPEAWDTLERDVDVEEKKVQMTIRLDASVAKFYRAMGKGYQARINRVLATFAQMRIAEIKRLEEMTAEELETVAGLREE